MELENIIKRLEQLSGTSRDTWKEPEEKANVSLDSTGPESKGFFPTNVPDNRRIEMLEVAGDNVCRNCPQDKGFSLSKETGYWHCAKCNKPSVYSAVYLCDVCEELFYSPKSLGDPNQLDFIMCEDCSVDEAS